MAAESYWLIDSHQTKYVPTLHCHIAWSSDQRISVVMEKAITIIDVTAGGWSMSYITNPMDMKPIRPYITRNDSLDDEDRYYIQEDTFCKVFSPTSVCDKIAFYRVYWSPCEILHNDGHCLLATVTTNHHLLLYNSSLIAQCLTTWNLIEDITSVYYEYLEQHQHLNRLSGLNAYNRLCYKAKLIAVTCAVWCDNTEIRRKKATCESRSSRDAVAGGLLIMCTRSGDVVMVEVLPTGQVTVSGVVPVLAECNTRQSPYITDVQTYSHSESDDTVTVIAACAGSVHVLFLTLVPSGAAQPTAGTAVHVSGRKVLDAGPVVPPITSILACDSTPGQQVIIVAQSFSRYHVYQCHLEPATSSVRVIRRETADNGHSMQVTGAFRSKYGRTPHSITTVSEDGTISTIHVTSPRQGPVTCSVSTLQSGSDSPISDGYLCAAACTSPHTSSLLITVESPCVFYDHLDTMGRYPCLIQVYQYTGPVESGCQTIVRRVIGDILGSERPPSSVLPYYEVLLWWRLLCASYKPGTYPDVITGYLDNYQTVSSVSILKLIRLFILIHHQQHSNTMMKAESKRCVQIIEDISELLLWRHILTSLRVTLRRSVTGRGVLSDTDVTACKLVDSANKWRYLRDDALIEMGHSVARTSTHAPEMCVYCDLPVRHSATSLLQRVTCDPPGGHVMSRCGHTLRLISPQHHAPQIAVCAMCRSQYIRDTGQPQQNITCLYCDVYL